MTHELEIRKDGTGAAVFALEPAWHRLGTVKKGLLTVAEALAEVPEVASPVIKEQQIRRVEKWDPKAKEMRGYQQKVDGHYWTVREYDNKVLGCVGEGYTVLQNAEALALADEITGNTEAKIESVISLKGGRWATMLLNLNNLGIKVAGKDAVDCYLLIQNSHDGSTKVRATITPVRVVCANTLAVAIEGATNMVNIKHSTNMRDRLGEIESLLKITHTYMSEFEQSATVLMHEKMDDKQWEEFLAKLIVFPKNAERVVVDGKEQPNRSLTIVENKHAELTSLWHNLERTQAKEYSGTKWGAMQAVSFWNQRMAKVQAKIGDKTLNPNWEADAERLREENRFLRTLPGNPSNVTDQAYKLLVTA